VKGGEAIPTRLIREVNGLCYIESNNYYIESRITKSSPCQNTYISTTTRLGLVVRVSG
jgi:hypothetical protein